jgi:A/G-specific adenine glycosylase
MASIYRHFTLPLLHWFDQYGRKNLPWQHPRDAYRVWISEIMLQQTQVKTVIPYFNRFMSSFPDIQTLANASEDDVLAHWSGLGYYTRARNLRKTAAIISNDFQGKFPEELDQLIKLPGIGPSTAAAIASLAFDKPTAILDGNVKRVLSRYFLIDGLPKQATVQQTLWKLANECMPKDNCANYTQSIMDLGATCCTTKKPTCEMCPLQLTCKAKIQNVVANYPNKNPKKILPHKQQQFLLLHNSNQLIYLEKRPPTGLWGGLWCLPSIDMENCPTRYVETTYQLKINNLKELTTINHSFSHFHLQIKVWAMMTTSKSHALAEHTGRWFSCHELNGLGLAKPVSDIINHFYS